MHVRCGICMCDVLWGMDVSMVQMQARRSILGCVGVVAGQYNIPISMNTFKKNTNQGTNNASYLFGSDASRTNIFSSQRESAPIFGNSITPPTLSTPPSPLQYTTPQDLAAAAATSLANPTQHPEISSSQPSQKSENKGEQNHSTANALQFEEKEKKGEKGQKREQGGEKIEEKEDGEKREKRQEGGEKKKEEGWKKRVKFVTSSSEKTRKEMELKNKEIEGIKKQGLEIQQQLLAAHKEELSYLKQQKNKQNRLKFLLENRPDKTDEIEDVKQEIENLSIKLANLHTKKTELQSAKTALSTREEADFEDFYLLEEQLDHNEKFQNLTAKVQTNESQIRQIISKYNTALSQYIQKYEKAPNQNLKDFFFKELQKLAADYQKLIEERNQLRFIVAESPFGDQIAVNQHNFDFEALVFQSSQSFYEYLTFLREKEESGIRPTEEEKSLKAMEHRLSPEQQQLIKRMQKVDLYKVEQEMKQKERQEQQQRKRKEQRLKEEYEREEEKKRVQEENRKAKEEERKKKQERQLQQLKFKQLKSTLQSTSDELQSTLQKIAGLQLHKVDKAHQLQQQIAAKEKGLEGVEQQKNKLQTLLKDIAQLTNTLGFQSQIQGFETLCQSTKNHIPTLTKELQEQKQRGQQLERQEEAQKKKEEEEEKKKKEEELARLPQMQTNFYQKEIEKMKGWQQSRPQTFRYLVMVQKYLNQLRIVMELGTIDPKELQRYEFDLCKYQRLVSEKASWMVKLKCGAECAEKSLGEETQQKAMTEVQRLQLELVPMEKLFNQSTVKSLLYKYPLEMLTKTKQELFEISEQSQIQKTSQRLTQLKAETKNIQANIQSKQKKIDELGPKRDTLLQHQQSEVERADNDRKKHILVGSEEKILKEDEQTHQYKVGVANKEGLKNKYEELNDDSALATIREQWEQVKKQKQIEKDWYEEARKKHWSTIEKNKQKIVKEVYLGDCQKVGQDERVQQLEKELKDLRQQLEEKKRGDNKRDTVDRGSKYRLVSRIEEF